jgi:hypothetical protein
MKNFQADLAQLKQETFLLNGIRLLKDLIQEELVEMSFSQISGLTLLKIVKLISRFGIYQQNK